MARSPLYPTDKLLTDSMVPLSQVGSDDLGVCHHFFGSTFHDLATGVEHDHAVGELHHRFHDVFHHHHGDPPFAHLANQLDHLPQLHHREPGHGLVQHEDLGLHSERHGHLQPLLVGNGQCEGAKIFLLAQAREGQHLFGPAAHIGHPGVPQEAAGHDVLQHRHVADDLHDLEGAHDAELADGVRLLVGDIPALEEHPALVHPVKPGHTAEERALAGAVGADDADDLTPVHLEGDVLVGLQPAEVFADALHIQQQRSAHLPSLRSLFRKEPHTPAGWYMEMMVIRVP